VNEIQRQLRLALGIILVIIPAGIIGFMVFEQLAFRDAAWLTFITLVTIGYGDFAAITDGGRLFTVFLVVFGFGALTAALQAFALLFLSPDIRNLRRRRHMYKKISQMRQHYIICGKGEIVDKTVGYVLQFAQSRRQVLLNQAFEPADIFLNKYFKPVAYLLRKPLYKLFMLYSDRIVRGQTLMDVVVVVTTDAAYAEHLLSAGLNAIEGNPTEDDVLRLAGIRHARALTAILDDDTETLLTVLTARHLHPTLPITASVLDDELGQKMIRVGANYVITPYDVAGQFLNNATLRPAVNDYFNSLLFDIETPYRLTQVVLAEGSPWIDKSLNDLGLQDRYSASLIGLRRADGMFVPAPTEDYTFEEDEVLIFVAPAVHIFTLNEEAKSDRLPNHAVISSQILHYTAVPPRGTRIYSLDESVHAIEEMSQHFIICGAGRVAHSAVARLNPDRPFVILTDDTKMAQEMLGRGFRVIQGDPHNEQTLLRAGVKRASAIMVAVDERAKSVLTVLACRSLNKRLLITATAPSDDMFDKLERAGADRVVSPFHVAARFILLSSTRPDISDYINAIIFNYITGLETTELYMETTSPWIGQTVGSLKVREQFQAGIIGIRMADKQNFVYAPAHDYVIEENQVLIVVTPMKNADELREVAHGSANKRPATLRRTHVLQSDQWSRDILRELIEQRGGGGAT
jgi:voltage-gated potassium channel